ncbi:cilia- and flagella-associated protein 68 [Discoglossus pictus]
MSAWSFSHPHYTSALEADGHGEVWVDINPYSKFKQYGWRCTTNEDSYSNKTLMGNWNQERYDLNKVQERKPLPSQYGHYYQTSYSNEYANKAGDVRQAFQKEPHSFPGHQPELDPPQAKPVQKSCYMMDYHTPCSLPLNTCRRQKDRKVPCLHPASLNDIMC